ncbi:MAG: tryptophan halogenase family protein [Psychrobium sp.]
MTEKTVKKIVIVGGGTAGWMTAAALAHQFKQQATDITVVDSSDIGTVGVGEATIPTIRRFYQRLGFTDHQVIKATSATCKLGIEFKGWNTPDSSFIHPFGLYGQNVNNLPFHHYWLKLKQHGNTTPLADYSLGVQLAKHDKFMPCISNPKNQLEIFDWALHFDAARFANLMKDYALEHGVTHVDSIIEQIDTNEDGEVSQLKLSNGQTISGDLFVDCSGFSGLLINKTLKVGYRDWSQWLLCDRAIAVQSESVAAPAPRTIVTAHEAGWQWTIPLQHRQGNGHVYSSRFTDDETAKKRLLENIDGPLTTEPRVFQFTPGRREQTWCKNVVAIGLASGFLEPLESTSIALIETAIDKLQQSIKSGAYSPQIINRFNEVTALEYERVRDFIILHYKANQRSESMWQYCREMSVPDTLQRKMSAYAQQGDLQRLPWEIFGQDSWLAIFDGFHQWPQQYHPQLDKMPLDVIKNGLASMHADVAKLWQQAPSHSDFLTQHFDYQLATNCENHS